MTITKLCPTTVEANSSTIQMNLETFFLFPAFTVIIRTDYFCMWCAII